MAEAVDSIAARIDAATADEFPGCIAFSMTEKEFLAFEGRLEVWDGDREIAWKAKMTGVEHERTAGRLAELVLRIGQARGARIECLGSAAIMLRNPAGRLHQAMAADQTVYLAPVGHTATDRLVVGENALPDVILEVDHTTDVTRGRPGKLKRYEAWGLPELWVEVPDTPSRSRPRRLKPGLTIHVCENGVYRRRAASETFPGWTAAAIHTALNEPEMSAATTAELERLGSVLGARIGTGPDDDPLLRHHRREARSEGRAAGREEARAEGLDQLRTLLARQAALRFGAQATARLQRLLGSIDDAARLAEAGDRIIAATSAAELTAAVEAMLAAATKPER